MRIPILRVGAHGDHEVTEGLIDQLIANTVLPVPLDAPNFSGRDFLNFSRPTDMTLGWVKSLDKQDGRLFATIELTHIGKLEFDHNLATVPGYDIGKDGTGAKLICVSQTAHPLLDPRNPEEK